MVYAVYDRVKQKCSVIGDTDPITLGSSILGYKQFGDVLNDGDTFHYMLVNITNGEWEAGLGTFNLLDQTISRAATSSSNNDTAVSFSSGEKEVFIAALTENILVRDPTSTNLFLKNQSANIQIDSSGNITLSNTVTISNSIKDSTGSTGSFGQVLTNTNTGVEWQNISAGLIKTFNILGAFNGSVIGTARFYTVSMDTIRTVVLNLDTATTAPIITTLYRNNIAIGNFTLPSGQITSTYGGLNYPINPGDYYTVSIISGMSGAARNFTLGLYNISL